MSIESVSLKSLINIGEHVNKLKTNNWTYSRLIHEIKKHNVYGIYYKQDKKQAIALEMKYTDTLDFEYAHNVNIIDNQYATTLAIDNDVIVDTDTMQQQSIDLSTEILIPVLLVISLFSLLRNVTMPSMSVPPPIFNQDVKVNVDKPEVTFEDVIGCDESKRELSEVVDMYMNREYMKFGERRYHEVYC